MPDTLLYGSQNFISGFCFIIAERFSYGGTDGATIVHFCFGRFDCASRINFGFGASPPSLFRAPAFGLFSRNASLWPSQLWHVGIESSESKVATSSPNKLAFPLSEGDRQSPLRIGSANLAASPCNRS